MNFDEAIAAAAERRDRITTAHDLIFKLTTHTDLCNLDAYAPDDTHDLAATDFRELMIADADSIDSVSPDTDALRDALTTLLDAADDSELARELLTSLYLSYSLCPMHTCDYQGCFDDEDPECAAIRLIHPNHDT